MSQTQSLFSSQCTTLPISVTSTASTSTALPASGDTIRITNEGPDHAFISIGTGAQTATLPNATPTATSTPVLAGTDVVLSLPNIATTLGSAGTFAAQTPLNISAICRSAKTALLNVQVGSGC